MSNNEGYLHWPSPHYDPHTIYIDGLFVETGMQGFSKKPSGSTLFAMKSHANITILQRLYFGAEAAQRRDGMTFQLEFQVFVDTLLEKIRSMAAYGSWFYFCPFDRATDIFNAVSGSTYSLTRPLASGIVSGITNVTHPEIITLDGVVNSGAASVAGQIVTAASTGVLQVDYTPVYKVVLLGDVDEKIGEINEILVSMTLEEVVAF